MTATARFDVTRWDDASYDEPSDAPHLSRIAIGKAFQGALDGVSTGEGLFCGMNDPDRGAGFVVSERFTGRLDGRDGTFVMQHGGIVGPGQPPRSFGNVVPGSGTGALSGLRGEVTFGDGHMLTLTYEIGGEAR